METQNKEIEQVEETQQLEIEQEQPSENLQELKKKFYLGLQEDNPESAKLYLGRQFISNEKLLTYCLVENLSQTWNIFFDEFPQLLETIDDLLIHKLFFLSIKYQRYTMMTKLYDVFGWDDQKLNWKNKNTKTILEYTFLNLALYYQHLPTIDFLLRNGANPLIQYPENGNTSYHLAVLIGNTSVMETLLQYVKDLNVVNFKKNTPLHFASENGNLDIITILVEYGVEVNKRNYDTNTPLDLAELEGHTQVVEYLEKFEVESHYQEAYYF
jgi:hypothetical protein